MVQDCESCDRAEVKLSLTRDKLVVKTNQIAPVLDMPNNVRTGLAVVKTDKSCLGIVYLHLLAVLQLVFEAQNVVAARKRFSFHRRLLGVFYHEPNAVHAPALELALPRRVINEGILSVTVQIAVAEVALEFHVTCSRDVKQ